MKECTTKLDPELEKELQRAEEFKHVEDMEADENGIVAWFSVMELSSRAFVSTCTAFPYFFAHVICKHGFSLFSKIGIFLLFAKLDLI